MFAKPDRGQGSAYTRLVRDTDELRRALDEIQIALSANTYPATSTPLIAFPIAKRGCSLPELECAAEQEMASPSTLCCVNLPEAFELAQKIQHKMPFRGAWFFQIRRAEDGTLALLEVAPRVAGSMAAHRVRGVNFTILSLYEALRVTVRSDH